LIADVIVLFPFHIPIPVPVLVYDGFKSTLSALRIKDFDEPDKHTSPDSDDTVEQKRVVWMRVPINFITAPLIADLFLLAILTIGRKEVHDGTVGANHIYPVDIMVFFITLAYIAISIDASGLIRWLAYRVLQIGGKNGHRLFFYLYTFFFALTTFMGNDPIILSGTPFLSYMTKVSINIQSPRAWIFTQFAVANIASAILVSSNPTNLVLAGAFDIKFITYTANIIVPVVVTAIVLFPFLLYVLFRDESLIPSSIEIHELPEELKSREPANPNIPYAKGAETADEGSELTRVSTLEEIMNPYLDKVGAIFGSVIMAATLITILALNAANNGEAFPAYWVTLPAAFIMFCFDLSSGWIRRSVTMEVAEKGRMEVEEAKKRQGVRVGGIEKQSGMTGLDDSTSKGETDDEKQPIESRTLGTSNSHPNGPSVLSERAPFDSRKDPHDSTSSGETDGISKQVVPRTRRRTLASATNDAWQWSRATFPTTTTVLSFLPLNLVPFALCIFVLVQALVTKGWIAVFAYGWTHWISATGTVGAIGGMAFLSVILCNFSGTNIGTTILLCRVIQAWVEINERRGGEISERTFWATVYSMALGVNYGAFSTAFSASLAGMLWVQILGRKGIRVGAREFAWVNLPIIVFTMVVGCAVLVGEVYVMRSEKAYTG